MTEDKDILALAKERFRVAESAESGNREEARDDLKFLHGEQWPDDIKSARESKQSPCLTINKIPLYKRQIVNDIRHIRPSIKVRPVDSGADPDTAEVINGMIRAIEQDSSAESAYDWAAEKAVDMGFGYFRILTEYESDESFDQVIKIRRVRNPFSIYLDPAAEAQDGSDMSYAFVLERMLKKEFEQKYPNADVKDVGLGEEQTSLQWYSDEHVYVAEYWTIETTTETISMIVDPMTGQQMIVPGDVEGAIATRQVERRKVMQYLMTGTEILEKNEWPGKYIPVVRVVGRETDIEGELYLQGITRDLKDPQRMYNYYRSADVERTALYSKSPWVGPKGSFKSPKWRTANTANHAFLEYEPVPGAAPPFRQPPPEASSAMVMQLQTAAEELKSITGIFDPGLGARSNEVSGIAINERRGESDVSNFDFVDNLGKALTYAGKILVDLIPKIYTGQRMQRILKQDGTDELVQLNAPYVDQGKEKFFDLQRGRYDVVVDIGPSYSTQRQEASESMLELLKAFPQAASVLGDLVAKNFDWPGADEMAKRLRLLLPPEILQDENPAIAQMIAMKDQQVQQANQQAQMLLQELNRMSLELQNKQREVQVKEAEVRRKIAADMMKHEHDMTDLELQAARDLSPVGVAY